MCYGVGYNCYTQLYYADTNVYNHFCIFLYTYDEFDIPLTLGKVSYIFVFPFVPASQVASDEVGFPYFSCVLQISRLVWLPGRDGRPASHLAITPRWDGSIRTYGTPHGPQKFRNPHFGFCFLGWWIYDFAEFQFFSESWSHAPSQARTIGGK